MHLIKSFLKSLKKLLFERAVVIASFRVAFTSGKKCRPNRHITQIGAGRSTKLRVPFGLVRSPLAERRVQFLSVFLSVFHVLFGINTFFRQFPKETYGVTTVEYEISYVAGL